MEEQRYITFCYHCGNKGVLDHISTATWKDEEFEYDNDGNIIYYDLIEHIDWQFLQCPVCNHPTLIEEYTLDIAHEDVKITTVFPKAPINKKGVPQGIANAFDSAVKTKGIDSDICLLSLRRVLEMICNDKSAEGKTLENKIDYLVQEKILPDMLNDACWIIRQLGNGAAHADKTSVYKYDVEQVIEYVATIIDYLYSLPVRITEMKRKIEEKKQRAK